MPLCIYTGVYICKSIGLDIYVCLLQILQKECLVNQEAHTSTAEYGDWVLNCSYVA